jgi:hypothetical protein
MCPNTQDSESDKISSVSSMSRLMHALTHDLLNQVGVIDLNLQLALFDGADSGFDRSSVERARSATKDLSDLLQLVQHWISSIESKNGLEASERQGLALNLLEAHLRRHGDPNDQLKIDSRANSIEVNSAQEGLFDQNRSSLPIAMLNYVLKESDRLLTKNQDSSISLSFN